MLGFPLVLGLCWAGLAAAGTRRGAEERTQAADKVNSARCASRCLALHITLLTATFRTLQSDRVLNWCENHRRCSQCLQPCKELWENREPNFHRGCQKQHECMASLESLSATRALKQGDCPPPQRAAGFAAACVESCNLDRECSGTRKCCSNGCGHTCQSPANLFKGVPLKPKKDMYFLEDNLGHLQVSWTSRFNVSIEPVLYILQRRWNSGIHPSEDDATPWQTVLMTMEDRAVLKDVRPHRWYQFRVSAVNSQGTRGFTTPSKHFFSLRDPLPPEEPHNIRVGNFTAHTDGSVSTRLFWETGREEELSIHHYRVSWSIRGVRRKESSRVTAVVACEVELEGLHPNTPYLIQVQAVTYWGQKRLRSGWSQLTFITPSTAIPPRKPGLPQGHEEVSNELPASHTHPGALRLEMGPPHYHNGQLQVKVFWKKRHPESLGDPKSYVLRWYPEVCAHNVTKVERNTTVKGTHFVITGLLFGCKYQVVVMVMSGQSLRSGATTYVTTPHCLALRGREGKSLSCTEEERPLVVRKSLLRPQKLTAAFHMVNDSLQGVLHWQVSQGAPGQDAVTGFHVSWLQLSGPGEPPASQNWILSPEQHMMTVEHLQPDSAYKVQVRALTARGRGPSVVKTVHTPQVNRTPL